LHDLEKRVAKKSCKNSELLNTLDLKNVDLKEIF